MVSMYCHYCHIHLHEQLLVCLNHHSHFEFLVAQVEINNYEHDLNNHHYLISRFKFPLLSYFFNNNVGNRLKTSLYVN